MNESAQQLFVQSEVFANRWQNIWNREALIVAGAFLYMFAPEKADSFLSEQHIALEIVQLVFPLLLFYLFVNMGYVLAIYLSVRRSLMDAFVDTYDLDDPDGRKQRSALTLATYNDSMVQMVAGINDSREGWLASKSTSGWVRQIPNAVVFAAGVIIFDIGNGAAIYMLGSTIDEIAHYSRGGISWSYSLGLIIPALTFSIFYIQFFRFHRNNTGIIKWLAIPLFIVASTTVIILVINDPLATNLK